ncbi:hypothetical protein M3614_22560, partial [Bacillus velezensis]|nr:hypothetical protein [Bacillus velezensis]
MAVTKGGALVVARPRPRHVVLQQPKGRFILRDTRRIPVAAFYRRLKPCFASQKRLAISLKNNRNLYLMSYIRLDRNFAGRDY